MIWYSPLSALLVGMLLLAASALLSRPGLSIPGLLLILPAYGLMTPLGANMLVLVIEYRVKLAEGASACDQVQMGVLLSGGLSRPAETKTDFAALTPETLARIFYWRKIPSNATAPVPTWIISGGGPFRIPEAEVIASFLHHLDPDAPTFQLETHSANTWESAQAIRKLLPAQSMRIWLASSALHLPRATFAFEQAGFDVCPMALNRHYMAVSGWTSLLPQSSSLAKSESGLHELLGELFYRLRRPGISAANGAGALRIPGAVFEKHPDASLSAGKQKLCEALVCPDPGPGAPKCRADPTFDALPEPPSQGIRIAMQPLMGAGGVSPMHFERICVRQQIHADQLLFMSALKNQSQQQGAR